jgi:hypothetical protein
LQRHADPLPHRGGVALDVEPADARRPGGRTQQRREHSHRRRLAGSVLPQVTEDLALADRQIDSVDCLDLRAEVLDQSLGGDRGAGHPGRSVLAGERWRCASLASEIGKRARMPMRKTQPADSLVRRK